MSSEHATFRWFNSYHVPLDVQIGIARLELPLDLKVNTPSVPGDVYVTAQIVCNQMTTHALSLGTVFGLTDEYRNALVWDQVLSFPLKIQNLSLDSILVVTAWTADDKVYGGTSMRLFDENGVLKSGKQKLVFFFDRPGDSNIASTPGDSFYNKFKSADHGFRMEKHLESYKTALLSIYRNGENGQSNLDWLDRLTLAQIQNILGETLTRDRAETSGDFFDFNFSSSREMMDCDVDAKAGADDAAEGQGEGEGQGQSTRLGLAGAGVGVGDGDGADLDAHIGIVDPWTSSSSSSSSWSSSDFQKNCLYNSNSLPNWGRRAEELDLQVLCCLVVELPVLPHVVLHEERSYHQVPIHNPMREYNTAFINPGAHPCAIRGEKGQVEYSLVKGTAFQGSMLRVIADWDFETDNLPNLAEEQNRKLNISTIRGGGGASDPHAKPNLEQKILLDRIINSSTRKLASADKDLLYRFRFALTENKKALTKVVLSIDWDMESERAEVPTLLELWKTKAPIDVADALKLLSNEVEFQNTTVRQYAVDVLRSASDEELHLFLLQLVQALRYEPMYATGSTGSSSASEEDDTDTATGIATGAATGTGGGGGGSTLGESKTAASSASVERERERDREREALASFVSPLAAFLFERAAASESLSLDLYWFLKVETDTQNDESRNLYTGILSAFMKDLITHGGNEGQILAEQMQALDVYMAEISACQREARKSGSKRWMLGRNDFVETTLNRLLVDRGLQRLPPRCESLPCPLDPNIRIISLEKMSKMFKSALHPCVIDFNARAKARGGGYRDSLNRASTSHTATGTAAGAATATALEGPVFKNRILFKCGDDLRQDQLIMYLFRLMDMLLKKVNLDLRLRSYGILATGQKDGIMEFVESTPISGVETPRQTIYDYLQLHNPDPVDPSRIHPECLDTFIKSCAGSCVLTYILGVGDRHHDNIMLTKRGQLFHIDFGFVFGKDPKPMPPPFRLSKGMVDAMGGIESEGFIKFGKNCCQAFNWLRKSANVILNLISLMGDSGIPVIEQMGLDAVLEVVESRLRLNLTDEEAEVFFLSLMESTIHAIMPDLIDLFHALAVRWK